MGVIGIAIPYRGSSGWATKPACFRMMCSGGGQDSLWQKACLRDDETTIKIKFALLRGGGPWGQRGISSKNAVFRRKRHDNKILKVQILLSRNFVVIAQAPNVLKVQVFPGPWFFFLCQELHLSQARLASSKQRLEHTVGYSQALFCPTIQVVLFHVSKGTFMRTGQKQKPLLSKTLEDEMHACKTR